MTTISGHFHEVIRFYKRVNKLTPTSLSTQLRASNQHLTSLSAGTKRKFVLELARNEVLEKLRK